MLKLSTVADIKEFVNLIMSQEKEFFQVINCTVNELNFYDIFNETINLSTDFYDVEITLSNIPFYVKFDLVKYVVTKVNGEEEITNFFNTIYNIPFESNSQLINEIKSDFAVCIDLAKECIKLENFEWPYLVLSYMYENIYSAATNYSKNIEELFYLLRILDLIIQEKLSINTNFFLNVELPNCNSIFEPQYTNNRENNELYKRLYEEYPEILRLYEQSISIVNRFVFINSIII